MLQLAIALGLLQSAATPSARTLTLSEPVRGRIETAAAARAPRFAFTAAANGTVAFSLVSTDFDPLLVVARESSPPMRVESGGLETDAWTSVILQSGERVELEVSARDGRAGEFEMQASTEVEPPRLRDPAVRSTIGRWRTAADRAKAAGGAKRELECLEHAGRLLAVHGPLSEARSVFEDAIGIAEATGAKESESSLRIRIADLDRLEGRIDQAVEALEHVRDTSTTPETRRIRARALEALGSAHLEGNRLALARACFEEELKLANEIGDPDSECRAQARLGSTLSRSGAFDAAAESLRQALDLAEGSGNTEREAEIWVAYGWHAEDQGRYPEACEHYRRARDLGPDPQTRAIALGGMGTALFSLHDLAESRRRFDESKDLAARIGIRSFEAKYLLAYGNLETELGEWDLAIALLEQALSIWSAEAYAWERANVLLSLAQTRQLRGTGTDFVDAEKEARLAVEIGKKLGDLRTEIDGTILLTNGPGEEMPAPPDVHAKLEDLGARSSATPDLEAAAKAWAALAWDDCKRHRDGTAIEGGNRAYEAFADLGQDEQCLASLDTVARAALHASDLDAAARALDRVVLVLDRGDLEDPTGASRSRTEFASFEGMAHDLTALRLEQPGLDASTAARWKAAAFETAGAWRARSLVERLIRRRAHSVPAESEALRSARAALGSARERMGALARLRVDSASIDGAYQKLRRARQDVERLDRTATKEGEVGTAARSLKGVSPSIARTVLPDERTALVEFAAGLERLYALVLGRDRLEWVDLGPRKPIEEAARCFVSLIARNEIPEGAPPATKGGTPGLVSIARTLYSGLLARVRAVLPASVDHLILVPTTDLADLPFEALIDSASPEPTPTTPFRDLEFVVKKLTIVYAPSVPALVELAHGSRPKQTPTLLILADPVYATTADAGVPSTSSLRGGSGLSTDPLEGMELDSLAHTRVEASQIANLFSSLAPRAAESEAAEALAIRNLQIGAGNHYRSQSGFELCLGSEATAAKFCEIASRFSMLHIAAHGFRSTSGYGDPLLALSGADGRPSALTCGRILELDLAADLVVLAACDTANGRKIDGEGVQSLARAFLYAGARSVVASLWEARDLEAGEMMTSFYRKLLKDRAPCSEALRQVKVEMLQGGGRRGKSSGSKDEVSRFTDSADPYFWASFVVLGSAN